MKNILLITLVLFSVTLFANDSTKKKKPLLRSNIYITNTSAFFNTDISDKAEKYSVKGNDKGVASSIAQIGLAVAYPKINMSIGISVSHTGYTTGKYYMGVKLPETEFYYTVNCVQILVNYNYHYLVTEKSSLYFGFAPGTRLNYVEKHYNKKYTAPSDLPEKDYEFIYNATLLGAQYTFGKKNRIGIKTEIGIGATGLIRIGALYNFNKKAS